MRVTRKHDSFRDRFGERLRDLRKGRGLTQEAVAKKLELSPGAYAAYEQGTSGPPIEMLGAIANLLETSTDHLLGRGLESFASTDDGCIRWRLAWDSKPDDAEQRAVQTWQRVVGGEKIADIAISQRRARHAVENDLRDLIFHDRIQSLEVNTDSDGQRLKEHFTVGNRPLLRDAWVARLGRIDPAWVRMVLLGRVARKFWMETVDSGFTVALCGGFAISRLVFELKRGDIKPGVNVVPIAASPMLEEPNVSANALCSAIAYRHYGLIGKTEELPPCLGGDVQGSPTALISKRVLDRAASADVVFLGIGGTETGALSKNLLDVRADYLRLAGLDLYTIQQKIMPRLVGNIMYYLIDGDGHPPEDFRQANERLVISIGLSGLEELVKTGKRVVILGTGRDKAAAVNAAIRSGRCSSIVIDDELETALLSRNS